MNYLISTIIPVYNCVDYLENAISSVISQINFNDVQLILVDDGSSDGSSEICDKYAALYDNIIVIHKSNGGVSEARNFGINAADGYWISFLDSDDSLKENFYVEMLKNNNEDLICCNIDANKCLPFNLTDYLSDGSYSFSDIVDKVYPLLLLRPVMFQCWNKMYKKEIIVSNNIQFPVGRKFAEDMVFVYEYIKYIRSFRFIENKLYYYYMHDNNTTSLVIKGFEVYRFIYTYISEYLKTIDYYDSEKEKYLATQFLDEVLGVFYISISCLNFNDSNIYISKIINDSLFSEIYYKIDLSYFNLFQKWIICCIKIKSALLLQISFKIKQKVEKFKLKLFYRKK